MLEEIASYLETKGFAPVLIGGLAMQAHGLARFTSDIDLAVDASAQEPLVLFMEGRGFETLHRSAGYSNHLRSPDSARVDFIYVDSRTLSQIMSRATVGEESHVPVAAAEHLIAMKLLAMKNDPARTIAELRDIQHLMAAPDIDLNQVGTISSETAS